MIALMRPALVVVGLFTAMLGLAVPLAFTGVAGLAFPHQAGGSLVQRDGRVVGSELIGQAFADPRYFHPRPSATAPEPYNAAASAASQLGPSSATLLASVQERVAGASGVPADAATASGSGLDPHISVENARGQISRVAAARGLAEDRVAAVAAAHVEGPEGGVLGQARITVLRLNLALDAAR